jgi:conjugal transfer pilus assembly protein TraF
VKAGKQAAVQKVFDKAGLWFFYASTCQYCIKEGPILKYLERMYHVNILAVSMDGQPLPGTEFEDVVVDAGGQMSQQLGVTKTPSMFLVSNDGQKIHKLSEGLVTLEDMLESILYIAQAAGFITEQELQESRDVRQYLMTDSPSGEQAVSDPEQPQVNAPSLVAIPKSELEAGPQALIAHLESRLNFPSHNSQLAPVAMSGGQQ